MATLKQRLHRKNSSGTYDTIHFETEASLVMTADGSDVETELSSLKSSVSSGKAAIASAVTDKGVSTAADATFNTMATNIRNIPVYTNTNDANATASQILSGYTAYVKGSKITGNIASQGAQTITPGTTAKTIAAGKYLSGNQTITGDSNLISGNIRSGVSIFGIPGSFSGGFSSVIEVPMYTGGYTNETGIIILNYTNYIKNINNFCIIVLGDDDVFYSPTSGGSGGAYSYGFMLAYRINGSNPINITAMTDRQHTGNVTARGNLSISGTTLNINYVYGASEPEGLVFLNNGSGILVVS